MHSLALFLSWFPPILFAWRLPTRASGYPPPGCLGHALSALCPQQRRRSCIVPVLVPVFPLYFPRVCGSIQEGRRFAHSFIELSARRPCPFQPRLPPKGVRSAGGR